MKKERENSTIENDGLTLRDIKYIIIFFLFGFGTPYLIQFELNFLGANMITLRDIIGLWIVTPAAMLLILLQIYSRK
jgi:hypothetical protein